MRLPSRASGLAPGAWFSKVESRFSKSSPALRKHYRIAESISSENTRYSRVPIYELEFYGIADRRVLSADARSDFNDEHSLPAASIKFISV
jgi:hypothetical protein